MDKSNLAVLSAMITPAVLIMACSSLILATSQRLGRVMERARKINDDFKRFGPDSAITDVESSLYRILSLALKRGRYLQRALSILYIALSTFIATSAVIGLIDITHIGKVWLPVSLGVMGVTLLLFASFLLIKESRVALKSVYKESEIILSMNQRFFINPEGTMNRWKTFLNKKNLFSKDDL